MIFSDLSMPGLDGFGLLDRLRNSADERISKLPFILISEDKSMLQEALGKGANDLITKPFQYQEIKNHAYIFNRIQTEVQNPESRVWLDDCRQHTHEGRRKDSNLIKKKNEA